MTDDTMSANNVEAEIIVGNLRALDPNLVVERKTKNANIKPGHVVTDNGETYPTVDRAVATDNNFVGLAWKYANPADIPDGWTADSSFLASKMIKVIRPHANQLRVAVILAPKASTGDTTNDVDEGDTLILSATAGELDGDADSAVASSKVVGRVAPNNAKTPNTSDADIIFIDY